MYDVAFETYRKLSESWLVAQQDMFRKIGEQGQAPDTGAASAAPPQPSEQVQKQTLQLAVEILTRQRDSLDAAYRSFIQLVEQTARTAEAKTPEQYRGLVEDIWRRWFDALKSQSESQIRDVHTWTDKSLEIVRSAQSARG